MKKALKIAGIISAGLVLFILLLGVFISSGVFNSFLTRSVCYFAGNQLNGTLKMDEIKGNVLSDFTLEHVQVLDSKGTIVELGSLTIRYGLWGLITKNIHIDSLILSGASLHLIEGADSLWNIAALLPISEATPEDTLPSAWRFSIAHLQLNDFEAQLIALDSTSDIPEKIYLQTILGFDYGAESLSLKVKELSLSTEKPSFEIMNLTLNAVLVDEVLRWQALDLSLPHSRISSNGALPIQQMDRAEIDLRAEPMDFADFKPWIENIHGQPSITLDLKHAGDSSILNLAVEQHEQSLHIHGVMSDFSGAASYALAMVLDSVNGEYWTQNESYNSNVNGIFNINGRGLSMKNNSISGQGEFVNRSVEEREQSNLSLSFEKEKEDVHAKLKGSTMFGFVDGSVLLHTIFAIPSYDIDLKLKKLNLAKLTSNKSFESDLNIDVKAKGHDINPETLTSSIQIKTDPSVIFGEPLHAMNASLQVEQNQFNLRGFRLLTPYLDASVEGKGNFNDTNQVAFNLALGQLDPVLKALHLSPFPIEGEIKGSISGPWDKLKLTTDLIISKLEMDTIKVYDSHSTIQTYFTFHERDTTREHSASINYIPSLSLENASLKVKSYIDSAIYKQLSLSETHFEMEKKGEDMHGNLLASTSLGGFETQFEVANSFSIPDYSFRVLSDQLNLRHLLNNDSLQTSLNLELIAEGRGFDKDSLSCEMEIYSRNSTVFGGPVEDLNSRISYQQGSYQLKQFEIITPFAELNVVGEGNVATHNSLQFHLTAKDLASLNGHVIPKRLWFVGDVKGMITGRPDSLDIRSSIRGNNLEYDALRIKGVMADATLQMRDSAYRGNVNILLSESQVMDMNFDTIHFRSDFNEKAASNLFHYSSSDSLHGTIKSDIRFGDVPVLYFQEVELVSPDSYWLGGGQNSFVSFGKDSIQFEEIHIESKESALKLNGVFAFNGKENLEISVENVDLAGLPGLALSSIALKGVLNANLKMTGTSDEPIIDGFVHLDKVSIDSFQFQRIGASFAYDNASLQFHSAIDEQNGRLGELNCSFPYELSFNKTIGMPADDTPIEAHLLLDRFDVSRIPAFISMSDVHTKGTLSANVNVSNTFAVPKLNGSVDLEQGDFQYDKLGMFYHDISLKSTFLNNQFLLDSLTLFSSKGSLQFKGVLEIDSLFKGELKRIDLNMKGSNFYLFNSEIAQAIINTDLVLEGSSRKPRFNGMLSVVRSSFNTDLFLQEFNKVYDNSEIPLLIQAQENRSLLVVDEVPERDTLKTPNSDFYRNLKGHFDIEFPRNTWVKGKNMNFEMAGSIKAIKEAEQIDFFGTLNVKRGYYKLYGRRLVFKEGDVIFTGGSSINPKLDFTVAYSFRDPTDALKTLNVLISERLLEPKISFSMDDVAIEEKEAISYLLFNKGLNQLDNRENNTLKNTNLNFALNQITGAIQDVVQSKLGLDVFEIEGNNGWTQSTISTGKYLTNNLYLNYEHTFAIDKRDKVISPQKISLEYQFYRSLFLQATNQSTNSGFDVILKWSWK